MKILTHTAALQACIRSEIDVNRSIGFVPTMGGLHAGHMSLIRASKQQCDRTVCSIFVNPTQFDDEDDLIQYPRPHDRDLAMLRDAGCDIVFVPSVAEVYPPGLDTGVSLKLKGMDEVLEGAFRPGHFAGVLQVVRRLLDMTTPDRLYMGQKDFQQQALVGKMIAQLDLEVELVVCSIVREDDGLAMSSRNERLTPEFRKKAPAIFQTLRMIGNRVSSSPVDEIISEAMDRLKNSGLRPEYVAIYNAKTFKPLKKWKSGNEAIALIAAWAGEVRLIDNAMVPGLDQ